MAGRPAPSAIEILAAHGRTPIGSAPERETVLLLNASPEAVDLTGWRIADRLKKTCPLPPGPLPAGATLTVAVAEGSSSATAAAPSRCSTPPG